MGCASVLIIGMARMTRLHISRRQVIALLPAAVALRGVTASAAETTITGTVSFRERMALVPGTVLEVKIVDILPADAPYETVAETRVPAGPGSPMPYTLTFNRARMLTYRSYTLQARIFDGDHLMFTTTKRHPIAAGGPSNTDIVVERAKG